MLVSREGLPEDSEIVLCTVTSVRNNSVFVQLDEYKVDGLIHISEVSPGRIRNIRDFVKEGKKIVCKVLTVDQERNHVNLSLRRVTDAQRRGKISEQKQEQKAEKILEHIATAHKKDMKTVYGQIMDAISDKYDYLYHFFQDIVNEETSISEFKIDKAMTKELETEVKKRLKPTDVSIKGKLEMVSYAPHGVEIIQQSIKKAVANKAVDIKYLSAGKYSIEVTAPNYKEAESILKEAIDNAIDHVEKNHGKATFSRQK